MASQAGTAAHLVRGRLRVRVRVRVRIGVRVGVRVRGRVRGRGRVRAGTAAHHRTTRVDQVRRAALVGGYG